MREGGLSREAAKCRPGSRRGACRRRGARVRPAPWGRRWSRPPSRCASLYTGRMTPRTPRLSAGVVVVRETSDGWRFLLLRAFNHWDFPKGMVEPGEEPRAAAVREVQEESLIEDLQFRWGDSSTRTGPYSRGKVAVYFIASTSGPRTSRCRSITSLTPGAQRVPLDGLTKRSRWSHAARAARGRVGRQRHEPATRILGRTSARSPRASRLRELVAYPRMPPRSRRYGRSVAAEASATSPAAGPKTTEVTHHVGRGSGSG